ncbi:MAG: L,D-transpeptidase family protein [Chitinivibrionales bacterium]|nr:L,D-transpeptidase family protein [Chitinivibrionales bacterium]MBD3394464.1 L,D-transpeptidase family protein [Chitinivibrionales bacterium]
MIESPIKQCSRFFRYRLKAAEFRYRTWRKRREIRRAYAERVPVGPAVRRWIPRIGLGVLAFAAVVLLAVAVPPAIRGVRQALQRRAEAIKRRPQEASEPVAPSPAPESVPSAPEHAPDEPITEDAAAAPEPKAESGRPASPWEVPREMTHVLLANKADKALYLLAQSGSGWTVRGRYDMAVGENGGRKERAGDKKTPEGRYCLIGRKEDSDLSEVYGPMAYVLDYPNDEDRAAGRTGQGIWIHGTSPDSTPLQTRGCLELDNEDLRELSGILGVGIGTPIVIVNKRRLADPAAYPDYALLARRRAAVVERYRRRQEEFVAFVDAWRRAWESMDMERYASFYDHESFRGQGQEWEEWRARKQRTFDAYTFVEVDVDRVVLTDFSPSTAVVRFIQGYASDLLQVENGKKLSLVRTDGRWKIRREETFPKEELLL